MNCCKNIRKFLKKNYKKIIVVCLIMLLLSNKMYEKFTTAQALDAVKSTETKVNNMVLNAGANHIDLKSKIRLSGKWSAYPDDAKDQAEISNDRGDYQALMLVGNKSAGGNRKVRLWDHLRVHGSQEVDSNLKVKGTSSQNRIVTNGLKINNPKKGATEMKIHDGYWGGWTSMKTCPDNTYVCGLKARVEGNQGGGDDTALNGIRMKCCKFNP